MGQSKSKALKYPHYPLPPGYPQYYPYAVPPQVGYMQGYPAPQPVIPPGYGGPVAMPQPHIVGWPPQQEHRRKKKKRSSARAPPPVDSRTTTAPGNVGNIQPAPAGMLDNLPPGFVPTSITPNPPGASGPGPIIPPVVPSNNTAQGAYPPPLFTPGVPDNAQLNDLPSPEPPTLRRAATPFVPPVAPNEGDDDDESEYGSRHRRSRSRSHRRAASEPRHFGAPQPISPNDPIASPGVPPNPLPQPPRDIYGLLPYKRVLQLPNTTALLTTTTTNPQNVTVYPAQNATVTRSGTNPGMAGIGAGTNAMQQPSAKKKKRGFFSFGSLRGRNPPVHPAQSQSQSHPVANIQFVPVYPDASQPPAASAPTSATPMAAHSSAGPSTGGGTMQHQGGTPVPPVPTPPSPEPQRSPPPDDYDEMSDDDDGVVPPDVYRSISPISQQSRSRFSQPYQPQPLPQPQSQIDQQQPYQFSQEPYLVSPGGSTLEFSHSSLPDFLNHSPHRVMYGNKIYPSAMHLHEAMKFMEHKPELAESVRLCERVEDVYPLTVRLQVWVRPDWGAVFLDKMEEVLWHKFTQHQHIRTMLLKTGNAKIVYADPQDPYWGSGAPFGSGGDYPGTNYLGLLLEKVREKLRLHSYVP